MQKKDIQKEVLHKKDDGTILGLTGKEIKLAKQKT